MGRVRGKALLLWARGCRSITFPEGWWTDESSVRTRQRGAGWLSPIWGLLLRLLSTGRSAWWRVLLRPGLLRAASQDVPDFGVRVFS